MKRTIATLAVVVLAAAPAWAQTSAPSDKSPGMDRSPGMTDRSSGKDAPGQSGKHEAREIEGKVKSVDKTSKRVILEDGTALTIPDSLKAKMGSLKSGTMVKATYEDMGGDKVATSLEVQPSAQKPRS